MIYFALRFDGSRLIRSCQHRHPRTDGLQVAIAPDLGLVFASFLHRYAAALHARELPSDCLFLSINLRQICLIQLLSYYKLRVHREAFVRVLAARPVH